MTCIGRHSISCATQAEFEVRTLRALDACHQQYDAEMRIAVVQLAGTRQEDWRKTLREMEDALDTAAAGGADAALLPECAWPAYYLESREHYWAQRRGGMPGSDEFLDWLGRQARGRRLLICAGFVQECGERLFNAAGVVDAAGSLCGICRKSFLWDFDHAWFDRGTELRPIETEWGPVGVLICADARLPEIPATLAQRGARWLLQPTAWVNAGAPDAPWNPQPEFLIAARAREFGLPIASASKSGIEGGTRFVGSSLICRPDGRVIVQAPVERPGVHLGEIVPCDAVPPRMSPDERSALTTTGRVCLPRADVPPLDVYPLPRSCSDAALQRFAQHPPSTPALGIAAPERGAGPVVYEGSGAIAFRGDCGALSAVAGVQIAVVNSSELERFAGIRTLAMRGTHLLVACGEHCDVHWIRTRAAENRMLVFAASAAGWLAVDSSGMVVDSGLWPEFPLSEPRVRLDVAAAANKKVANATDVMLDRTPAHYAL